jgi:hypothetical protein
VRRGDFAGAVEPLRAGLLRACDGEVPVQTAEAVCYVAEWLAGQGDRHRAGLLLAHLFRLRLAGSDAITLRSTLGLSNEEIAATSASTATLDLDAVAALALTLLPPLVDCVSDLSSGHAWKSRRIC